MYLSFCQYYTVSFIVIFKIREQESFNITFPFQICFDCSGCFLFPCKIQDRSIHLHKTDIKENNHFVIKNAKTCHQIDIQSHLLYVHSLAKYNWNNRPEALQNTTKENLYNTLDTLILLQIHPAHMILIKKRKLLREIFNDKDLTENWTNCQAPRSIWLFLCSHHGSELIFYVSFILMWVSLW